MIFSPSLIHILFFCYKESNASSKASSIGFGKYSDHITFCTLHCVIDLGSLFYSSRLILSNSIRLDGMCLWTSGLSIDVVWGLSLGFGRGTQGQSETYPEAIAALYVLGHRHAEWWTVAGT